MGLGGRSNRVDRGAAIGHGALLNLSGVLRQQPGTYARHAASACLAA